ncbi:MAG: hypothetical protein RR314_05380 [Oscillospiraceae bacterium]
MAKQGMARPERTHTQPHNSAPPVPALQGKAKKHRQRNAEPNVNINPEERLCAKFDCTGIATFPVSDLKMQDPLVKDNCAEEHIQ